MPSQTRIRYFSAACVALNCLTAGSIFTFPLLSAPLATALHLSATQLSTLATSAVLAQYALAPPMGSLVDKRGPGAASFLAGLCFAAGYGMMGWTYRRSVQLEREGGEVAEGIWLYLCGYYALAGAGTAGSYFAAMIAATRSFPERHAGLTIAVPCSLFGLSPLFLATLARFFTVPVTGTTAAKEVAEELDLGRWLYFLAILIGAVNLFGGVGLKVLPWEDEYATVEESAAPNGLERSPSRPPGYDTGCAVSTESLCEVDGLPDERTPLVPKPATEDAAGQSLGALLRSPPFWLFGLVLLLSTGPCEMVMASLGGIIEAILGVHISAPGPNASIATPTSLVVLSALAGAPVDGRGLTLRRQHVQVISIFNTLSRLVVGAVSDYLSPATSTPPLAPPTPKRWQRLLRLPPNRPHLSRLFFPLLASLALALSFFISAFTLSTPAGLWGLTLPLGCAYGTIFIAAPAVVRSVWPAREFGRNWGLLTWFAAAGAGVFTPVFGWMADRVAKRQGEDVALGREAFEGVFVVAGVSCAVAAGLVGVLWRGYWRGKV